MHKCCWRTLWITRQKHCRPRNNGRWTLGHLLNNEIERHFCLAGFLGKVTGAAHPGPHDDDQNGCKSDRRPAAFMHLDDIRAEEHDVDDKKAKDQRQCTADTPVPDTRHDKIKKPCRNQHIACHSDTVCGRQIIRLLKAKHQNDNGQTQQKIDARNINLPVQLFRSVLDFKAWQNIELHGLTRHRKCTADNRLTGNHGCCCCQQNHRPERKFRHHLKEW
ncbi:hypothetical protein D9M70_543460 [compost metagenome]